MLDLSKKVQNITNDAHLYAQHLSSLHGLPVFGDKLQPQETPTESDFGGNLQNFEVFNNSDAVVSTDLARFILSEKPRIENLVQEKLLNRPQKFSFV